MTGRALVTLWRARDNRYRERTVRGNPSPLTPNEESSVLAFRRSEAEALTGEERVFALVALSAWTRPVTTR
jgi:hypothetical protein